MITTADRKSAQPAQLKIGRDQLQHERHRTDEHDLKAAEA
jgi:hypothetical protein